MVERDGSVPSGGPLLDLMLENICTDAQTGISFFIISSGEVAVHFFQSHPGGFFISNEVVELQAFKLLCGNSVQFN